jgi:hypothetical protein
MIISAVIAQAVSPRWEEAVSVVLGVDWLNRYSLGAALLATLVNVAMTLTRADAIALLIAGMQLITSLSSVCTLQSCVLAVMVQQAIMPGRCTACTWTG